MVSGYALANRQDTDLEVSVITEDDPSVVTYVPSYTFPLTRMCRNACSYCSFSRKDNLVVPYSTIRQAKQAKELGAREAFFLSGERPDKLPHIRATLDLWGFQSFSEYIYSVSELSFLEGLVPVIELGFLSPKELKDLSEVNAAIKIMLDSVDASKEAKFYAESPGKLLELRLKSLQWASKLKFPIITGLMVGIGESKKHREEILNEIKDLHESYGMIHEVLIQNFIPQTRTGMADCAPPTELEMIETFEMARDILPDTVPVTIPIELNDNLEEFLKVGLRDFGRISLGSKTLYRGQKQYTHDELQELLNPFELTLQARFPIRKAFIGEGIYSKKLGQMFEAYKYKIKKASQEK